MSLSVAGEKDYFRYGALGELGFEVMDLCNNLLGMYPYAEGRVKKEVRIGVALHHLPGVFLTLPILYNGVHANPHLQLLGGWLLFTGAILLYFFCSHLSKGCSNGTNYENQTDTIP
jgi:hypothetical protein